MTKKYSSNFDVESLDYTFLSIPEICTEYVYPFLAMLLHGIATILYYSLATLVQLLYVLLRTVLWPVYVCCRFFVVRPIIYFYHLCHLLYPVAMYVLAAVVCGVVIGCCAGFTAEALSSFFINATWGPGFSLRKSNSFSKEHDGDDDDDNYNDKLNDNNMNEGHGEFGIDDDGGGMDDDDDDDDDWNHIFDHSQKMTSLSRTHRLSSTLKMFTNDSNKGGNVNARRDSMDDLDDDSIEDLQSRPAALVNETKAKTWFKDKGKQAAQRLQPIMSMTSTKSLKTSRNFNNTDHTNHHTD